MTDQMEDLARKVRYLLDRQDIVDCIQAYARALDRLDMDLMAECFTEDMVDQHGPFTGGLDEFLEFARQSGESGALTHHGLTTHTCTIDGDTAHAETYVQFLSLSPDRSTVRIGAGRYVDRLERRSGAWRIAHRRFVMECAMRGEAFDWLGGQWGEPAGRRDRQDLSYDHFKG